MTFFKIKPPDHGDFVAWYEGNTKWLAHTFAPINDTRLIIPPDVWLEEMEAGFDSNQPSAYKGFDELSDALLEALGFEGGIEDPPRKFMMKKGEGGPNFVTGYPAALGWARYVLGLIWDAGVSEAKALIGTGKPFESGSGFPSIKIGDSWYGPPTMDDRFVDGEFQGWHHPYWEAGVKKFRTYGPDLDDCIEFTLRYEREQTNPYKRQRCLTKEGPHQFCIESGGNKTVFAAVPSVDSMSINSVPKPGLAGCWEVRVDFRVFVYCQDCKGSEPDGLGTQPSYPASLMFLCRPENYIHIYSMCHLYRYWAYAWTAPFLTPTNSPNYNGFLPRDVQQSKFASLYRQDHYLCGQCDPTEPNDEVENEAIACQEDCATLSPNSTNYDKALSYLKSGVEASGSKISIPTKYDYFEYCTIATSPGSVGEGEFWVAGVSFSGGKYKAGVGMKLTGDVSNAAVKACAAAYAQVQQCFYDKDDATYADINTWLNNAPAKRVIAV